MADREKLQTVEVTMPSGFQTRVRTRRPERYRRMEEAANQQAERREKGERKARQPRGAAVSSGDVATKS